MIYYAIKTAKESNLFDNIIIINDNNEIKEITLYGAQVTIKTR